MKALAVMYGTGEGRDGSWNSAFAVIEFSGERRNLEVESEDHFLPSASTLSLSEEPQFRRILTASSLAPFKTSNPLKRKKMKMSENKTWVLVFMSEEDNPFEEMERRGD